MKHAKSFKDQWLLSSTHVIATVVGGNESSSLAKIGERVSVSLATRPTVPHHRNAPPTVLNDRFQSIADEGYLYDFLEF